ncbi:hypothetical protein BV898_07483 [Hypsibius exemplaris]|uniref:Centriolar and ciliogenesis-associated protein HYLS1 C-terminal domain-containing protein n=1 Tax=Hypsibius exemplaris TaxID=2072580 RepID=A0A1W0WTE2_HYPEX|nr:hypothetical protein BV898_07483 [Hypsibius exemplaris]
MNFSKGALCDGPLGRSGVSCSNSKSSETIGSTRTRITAPRRDHHGEPLGKPTIVRPIDSQMSLSQRIHHQIEGSGSWITDSSSVGGFTRARTLQSAKHESKNSILLDSMRSKQFDKYSEEVSGGEDYENHPGLGGAVSSSKDQFVSESSNRLPFRVKPRATKSVLYDTVDQKQYRDPRLKSDPVSLYTQYQVYWKENQIPGENPHRELRWNIRATLMQKDYEVPLNRAARRPRTPVDHRDGRDDGDHFYDTFPEDDRAFSLASTEAGYSVASSIDGWTPPPPPPRRTGNRKLHRLIFAAP